VLPRGAASLSPEACRRRALYAAVALGAVLVACSEDPGGQTPARVGLTVRFDDPTDLALGACRLGSTRSYSIGIPPPSSSASQGTPVTSGQNDVDVTCRVAPDPATSVLYSVTAKVYSPHLVLKLSGSTSGLQATGTLELELATIERDMSTESCSLNTTSAPFAAGPGEMWGSFECPNATAEGAGLACNVAGLLLLTGCSP
jgi:hypothetical protein